MSIVRKTGAFGLAALASVAIVAVGQGVWQPLVVANLRSGPQIPWAAPVMAAVLAGLLLYLSGRGWPARTSAARRRLLRWNRIPWPVFFGAVGAGLLGLAALCGLWITTADLVHIPAGIQPRMTGVPLASAIVFLVMSSLAAPLSEEAAFRGYAMGLLEKAWGGAGAAIVGSSVLFAAVHLLQGVDPFKLGLYFTAGVLFAAVAWTTNSLFPAMVVHSLADVAGFTVLWPHDARVHGMGFADPLFAPALAALVVFTPLSVWAFRRLAGRTRGLRRPSTTPALAAA